MQYERGCSFYFGYRAVRKFLDDNELLCIVRAHQVPTASPDAIQHIYIYIYVWSFVCLLSSSLKCANTALNLPLSLV